MTDTVDNTYHVIPFSGICTDESSLIENGKEPAENLTAFKPKKLLCKLCSVLKISAERLRALSPFISFQILQQCLELCRRNCLNRDMSVEREISLSSEKTENRTIDNSKRQNALIFMFTGNGRF